MNTPLNDALKPCPFCGGAPVHKVWSDHEYNNIECAECGFDMDYNATYKEAADRWNTRANTPESSAAQGAMGDERALNLSRQIMAIVNGTWHPGGAAQIQAKIQEAIIAANMPESEMRFKKPKGQPVRLKPLVVKQLADLIMSLSLRVAEQANNPNDTELCKQADDMLIDLAQPSDATAQQIYQIRHIYDTPVCPVYAWSDVSEDAYNLTPEDDRRILYVSLANTAQGKQEQDAIDAIRYRKILAASERAFPVLSVCDDPENDAVHKYGRKNIDELVDAYDEIQPIERDALAAKKG